jgi:hypothetical protein
MLPDTAANVRVSPDEVIGPANRMSSSSVLPAISFRCFFNPRPLHRAVDAVSVYPTYRKPFDMIFQRAKTGEWWAWVDLNHRPRPYQGRALAT